MYSALAEHFDEGGDYEKAAQFFLLAQERSLRTSMFTEAIAFSKRAVACLEKLPSTVEGQKQVIDARVTLARNCMKLNHYVEARDAVAPIEDLVQQLDYRKSLPAIYSVKAAYLIMVEEKINDNEARRYMTEAQKLALEENDFLSLVHIYFHEGLVHGINCEFAEGESCYQRLLEMAEATGNLWGLVVAKTNIVQAIYSNDGRIDAALKCGQEALQLVLQTDDQWMKGAAYWACSTAFFKKGLFPEAEENLTLAIETIQKTDFSLRRLTSLGQLGRLRFEMGQYQEAQECFDGMLEVSEHLRIWPSMARLVQIQKVAAGVRGGLDPVLDAMLTFDLQEIKLRYQQGMAAQAMGEIYLYIDDKHMDEAETWIRKAIELDEQHKMPWDLARDYALYAEFFKKKADPAQAKEKLGKAIDLMRSIGADGWVKKYEAELAGL
jgi:tetratricopeptide (TPR) repeat protein